MGAVRNQHLIPQILREGLFPQLGERSGQCEEVDEEIPLGVLKVTIPESWEKNIFIDPNAAYEAICKVPIPPEFIQEHITYIDF